MIVPTIFYFQVLRRSIKKREYYNLIIGQLTPHSSPEGGFSQIKIFQLHCMDGEGANKRIGGFLMLTNASHPEYLQSHKKP
jgi:hypothetical protein